MSKPKPGFNSPFAKAQDQLKKLVEKPKDEKKPAAPFKSPTPPPTKHLSDAELFADAVAGTSRIDTDPRGRIGAPPPTAPPISRRAADEAEAYAALADLVEGAGPFEMTATDEYLEFCAPGVNKQLVRKLRAGDFALQGHIDLHGMTQPEAQIAVSKFIEQSRLGGKRCVLIVTGRGLNSKDQVPVLKERVRIWLERGRLSRQVLAFSSARQCDGGTGAMYVLLRR